jgi:integrase
MFRRALDTAGLTGVSFHDLRRSFVTNARRRRVPESVVMKMSGHRTRSVFDRYNIIEEDDLREAREAHRGRGSPSPGSVPRTTAPSKKTAPTSNHT